MPRQYSLGKRTAKVAETRARIVDAAVASYVDIGITRTTMLDVARRADVAAGTVANHFATPDDLARAVIEHLAGTLRMPTDEIFAGVVGVADRVGRLASELIDLYERAEPWYRMYAADSVVGDVWAVAEARFAGDVEALIRTALGPLGDDELAVAAVATLLGPSVTGGLRAHGLSSAETAQLIVEMAGPWLERRASPAHGYRKELA